MEPLDQSAPTREAPSTTASIMRIGAVPCSPSSMPDVLRPSTYW